MTKLNFHGMIVLFFRSKGKLGLASVPEGGKFTKERRIKGCGLFFRRGVALVEGPAILEVAPRAFPGLSRGGLLQVVGNKIGLNTRLNVV